MSPTSRHPRRRPERRRKAAPRPSEPRGIECDELRLHIWRVGEDRYLVLANGPEQAAEIVTLRHPLEWYAKRFAELFDLDLEERRAGASASANKDLQDLGRNLFDTFLPQPICEVVKQSLNAAKIAHRQLRLRFHTDRELMDLPFEVLAAPSGDWLDRLALHPSLSITRSIGGATPKQRLPNPTEAWGRVKIAVVVAAPSGRPLYASRELERLEGALPPYLRAGHPFQFLGWKDERRATPARVAEFFTQLGSEPSAALVIAHGDYDQRTNQGVVLLENEDGTAKPVSGAVFAGLLEKAQGLRLVVLNLCQGATSAPGEPFSGLAQALVGAGIPAVVAMRSEITDVAAAELSPAVFGAVCRNLTIDEATSEARRATERTGAMTIEWCTPRLFLHDGSGEARLFKVKQRTDHDEAEGGWDPERVLRDINQATNDEQSEAAARYGARRRQWREVADHANYLFARHPDEPRFEKLLAEAVLEQRIDTVRDLCGALAAGDPEKAADLLDEVGDAMREPLRAKLQAEIEEARSVARDYRDIVTAEKREDWATVERRADDLLERRAGFKDVSERRRRAREELALSARLADAERALADEDWPRAATLLDDLLDKRPNEYRSANADRFYARGRIAEAAASWQAALEVYEQAAAQEYQDAKLRADYARGRLAEGLEHWSDARAAYDRAAGVCDAASRAGYARARASEAAELWEEACSEFEALGDYEDAPRRRIRATARAAAARGSWPDALAALAALGDNDEQDLRATARAHVDAAAARAEAAGDWSEAIRLHRLLPDEYRDVNARCAYSRGRSAAQAERWLEAIEALETAAVAVPEAAVHLGYARARHAEDEARFGEARAELERLPRDHGDVRERAFYAAGRAADDGRDWQGVIDGFSVLPDRYRDGDVGRRRRHARGRLAYAAESWEEVLATLSELPTKYRDGEADRIRSYAEGRRLEQDGHWTAAIAAYDTLDGEERDSAARRGYCMARASELRDEWEAARATYASLPADHGDTAMRLAYATARVAERDGDWAAAVGEYERVPIADWQDTSARLERCRLRAADERNDWEAVLARADVPPDLASIRQYATARLAEAGEDWATAAVAFAASGTHRDAASRVAYAEGRAAEARGAWNAALDAYARVDPTYADLPARTARLAALRSGAPWADGLADAALVADTLVTHDLYAALRSAGVTPSSTAHAVRNASFALMEVGAMTPEARRAWDQLRSPRARLGVDALLHRLSNPSGLREVQRTVVVDTPADVLPALCAALPDDAPLFLLLAGRRAQAVEDWQRHASAHPEDLRVHHALAVAFLWSAQDLETTGAFEQAEAAWEQAIGCWGVVLSDDQYWAAWHRDRVAAYRDPISRGDPSQVRNDVSQHLLDVLAGHARRYAEQAKARRARTYRQLALMLEVELEGARSLKDAGGVPVADRHVAFGPLGVRHAGHALALARIVARLDAESVARGEPGQIQMRTPLDAALGVDDAASAARLTPDALQRLRCMFSRLGPALMRLDRHEAEEALAALPRTASSHLADLPPDCEAGEGTMSDEHYAECPTCRAFAEQDPAYLCLPHRQARLLQDGAALAVRAHLELAQAALVVGADVAEPLRHWRAAIEVAQRAGAQVRTKRAIVRVVLGRCNALEQERGPRRGERLTEAIALIEAARQVVGRTDDRQLDAKAAELLTFRGVWFGYGCREYQEPDYEKAAGDLREALELNPDSIDARDNLSRALIFNAGNLPPGTAAVRRLITEAIVVLNNGLRRATGHRQFVGMLRRALDVLEETVLGELSLEELTAHVNRPSNGTEGARSDGPHRLIWLIRAVRRDPDDVATRGSLLEALTGGGS